MIARTIKITEDDIQRLSSLLELWRYQRSSDREHLDALAEELDRAEVVSSDELPSDVVAMNSRVIVTDLDTGQRHDYQIVFPRDADLSEGKISVLAPIGTALLGYSVGHEIEWAVPAGVRRLRIDAGAHAPANRPAHVA
jgi:regulator of nucleoside diphosphate kinase